MATQFPYNSTSPLNSDGFAFNVEQLRKEILNNVLITTALDKITGTGQEDICVYFVANLSGAEEAQLNNTVALHVPSDAEPELAIGLDTFVFIFKPGNDKERTGPSIFSDWDDLYARYDEFSAAQRRYILFDDENGTCVIPAGTYDLRNTSLEGVSANSLSVVTVSDGVTLTNPPTDVTRLDVTWEGSSGGAVSSSEVLVLTDSIMRATTAPMFLITGSGTQYVILMRGLSELNNAGNYVCQLGDTLANLRIIVEATSIIGEDTLADVASANEMDVEAFGVDNVHPTQPSLAHTILSSGNRKVLLAKANDYDPSGSVTPLVATDVQAAIDELDFNFQAGSSSYGNNHEYYEDETPQTVTGTTTPQPVATFITSVLPAGDYYVEWYIESAISSNNNVTQMQIELDAVNIAMTEQNTRTSTSFFPTSGFAMRTLTNAAHTVQVLAAPDQIGRTSFIQRIRLRVHRIS